MQFGTEVNRLPLRHRFIFLAIKRAKKGYPKGCSFFEQGRGSDPEGAGEQETPPG